MAKHDAVVSCKRSLLRAASTATLAAILLFGNASISSGQQADEASELNKQVVELYNAGRYADTIPIAQQVLAADVATSLNNLGLLYRDQGRYAA